MWLFFYTLVLYRAGYRKNFNKQTSFVGLHSYVWGFVLNIKIMVIAWFSAGITSAVACKYALLMYEDVLPVYIEIDSAHKDNERFIYDCENWFGTKIKRIRSPKYKDQFDVIKKDKYVNGAGGARCTLVLKKNVRHKFENGIEYKNQVFGFEWSKKEHNRAIRFKEQYPHTNPLYPLIEKQITKKQCAEILLRNGIALPKMYELGFHNNNCIGCVKGGKGYWNQIRKYFPNYFNKMSKLEREVGRTCLRTSIKEFYIDEDGDENVRLVPVPLYLDELKPNEGMHEPPIIPNCGTFCEIEFADVIDSEVERVWSKLENGKQSSLF